MVSFDRKPVHVMNGTSLQTWSLQMQAKESSHLRVLDVLLATAKDFLSTKIEALPDLGAWRYDFVVCGMEEGAWDEDVIFDLSRDFERVPQSKFGHKDTVEFNFHISPKQDFPDTAFEQKPRTYTVIDQDFNIFWTYYPESRAVRGLIFYMGEEGTSETSHIFEELPKYHRYRSWPLLPALLSLQTELMSMRFWVDAESADIQALQLRTGYHNYTQCRGFSNEDPDIDLVAASKEANGLAANIITSVHCLQQITRLANFVSEESDSLANLVTSMDAVPPSFEWVHLLPQLKEHIGCWRRSSESLLDNAEAWKQKATLMVQTMFTLTTQRDQNLSIQIAQDSRTLARKATRDSTSMKAIAAVTMCFLPGTFIAVYHLSSAVISKSC